MEEKVQSQRRIIEGKVVSNKMQGTVKVLVEYKIAHPKYFKVVKRRKVFFAHTDEKLEEGAIVKMKECRPYSKNIRWVIVK